jgi:hypothetical protein
LPGLGPARDANRKPAALPNAPCEWRTDSRKLSAFSFRLSAHGAGRLHGSTKLAGEGRLWMMRCTPLISIVAQSLCMAVILPPVTRHSRPAVQVVSGRVG